MVRVLQIVLKGHHQLRCDDQAPGFFRVQGTALSFNVFPAKAAAMYQIQ